MGVVDKVLSLLFGDGRNVVRETAEIFRENADRAGNRDHQMQAATLRQFASEFANPRKGWFDRFIDGLNRIPRPAMALGVLGLFITAMTDPIWFASRMQGIALVPEPLWWLLGAIVSFYFGARHQTKGQNFQRSIAATMANAPVVTRNIAALNALEAGAGQATSEGLGHGPNPALEDWRQADDR